MFGRNTETMNKLMYWLLAIVCLQGCSKDAGRTTAPQIVQLHLVYEKTGGFRGGTSDRLEIVYPPDEEPRAGIAYVSEDQAVRLRSLRMSLCLHGDQCRDLGSKTYSRIAFP